MAIIVDTSPYESYHGKKPYGNNLYVFVVDVDGGGKVVYNSDERYSKALKAAKEYIRKAVGSKDVTVEVRPY